MESNAAPILDVISYADPSATGLVDPGKGFESLRTAVRAVALDERGRVYMVSARHRTSKYLKLPGGGVDEGETLEAALHREVAEEVGYKIKIGELVGQIIQFDQVEGFRQDSICFLAEVTGGDGRPNFTAKELEHNFQPLTFDSLDAAIAAVRAVKPGGNHSRSITRRELAFLEAARRML